MIDQTHNLATKPFSRFSRKYLKTSLLRLLYHTGENYSKQNQQGSILIYLVVVIVVASALGAGIVSMTTTSTFTGLSYNPSDQARFLAQSGIEHAKGSPQGFEAFNKTVFNLENGEFELTVVENNGEYDITSIAWVHKGTSREASFKITYKGYSPLEGNGNNNDNDNGHVDIHQVSGPLRFQGSEIAGHGQTMLIDEDLTTDDLNLGSHINVSNIFIGGDVQLSGGSASLGSSQDPGFIYVDGNLEFWTGARNIYGDVYVNGNFRLKDARIHGNVYVDGDVELGWTPWLSDDSRIYYTGSLTHPSHYNVSVLTKCISVDSLESASGYDKNLQMPSRDLPGPRSDQWYADRNYMSSGTLTSNLKIFADTYESTFWRPSAFDVVIVSRGDITITGLGGSGLTGVLFAPDGKVTFQGGFFEGTVISRDGFFVTSGGTIVTFKSIEEYFDDPNDMPMDM